MGGMDDAVPEGSAVAGVFYSLHLGGAGTTGDRERGRRKNETASAAPKAAGLPLIV